MKKSSVLGLATMFAAMSSMGGGGGLDKPTAEEILSRKRKKTKLIVPNGLKEFNIDGVVIYALNEKNAIKKFNNLKNKNNGTKQQ